MANGLLDFLQGASNSAAANVSAPIDGIAWLLRKAGINVDRPVMGSDWMRERGLTAEPTNKLAGILGESVGGVLPMVTAAKAPQIAQGLLQAERNLAAPRALNPQTGAILWHGSPHKFDAFDSSKIGTGEGAQAYGHGLYLADAPDVAKGYQQATSKDRFITKGGYFDPSDLEHLNVRAVTRKGNLDDAIEQAKKYAVPDSDYPEVAAKAARDLAKLEAIKNSGGMSVNTGALYKVDLPDEHIAKMLDWDKPLSKQHPDVQKALKGIETKFPEIQDFNLRKWMDTDPLASTWHNVLQRDLGSDPAFITDSLRQRGVPGIRYLDGGSRGTGAGTSNYVVFPGNEGLLSILERNGQPIK